MKKDNNGVWRFAFTRRTEAIKIATVLFFFILVPVQGLRAQTTLGSAAVSGTVTDPSGGFVPAARVLLIDMARNFSRETVTDSAGSFLFPSVAPAVYSLRVTKEGFAAYDVQDVRVEVGQRANLNVILKLGQVSTVVSVSAGKQVLLETQSNALGTVVDSTRVQSLPLNGRNFLQLAVITAGVETPVGTSLAAITQTGHPDRGIIIDGQVSSATGYAIDGIATRGGRVGESAVNVSIADIDQFKVQQSFFMPDQGPNPGLVNVTTKSGTNQIHGQAFEFVRNDAMDARSFFSPEPESLKRNQFGGAVGGPIRKDKMWFFANYEGLRQVSAGVASGYTPTAAMFSGDFSGLSTPIYNPLTFDSTTGKREAFAGNVIPASMINPVSKALLKYYLSGASLAETPSNIFGYPRTILNDDTYGGRIDAALTDRQTLYGQYIHENSPATTPGLMPLTGSYYPIQNDLVAIQYAYALRPNLINTFLIGGVRNYALDANPALSLPSIGAAVGITNPVDGHGVPEVSLQGYTGFGDANGTLGNIDNQYQLNDGLNYIRGTHDLQFGAGIHYIRTWQENASANANGSLTFLPQFSAQLVTNAEGNLTPETGTGNAFADFLLGMPNETYTEGLPMIPYRYTEFMPYFADTWKLTRSLTLNYGISWFLSTIPNPQGKYHEWSHAFDPQTGLLTYAALGQVSPEIMSTAYNHFTPRFGFAWQPHFLPNTVIRSGIGVYFFEDNLIELQGGMIAPPYTTGNTYTNSETNPQPTYVLGTNVFPPPSPLPLSTTFAASLPSPITAFVLNPTGRAPYATQWNFSVQHALSPRDAIEVDYIGSGSHKLQTRYDPSMCVPLPDLQCNKATSPYPRYAQLLYLDFAGNSTYDALVAKYRRHVASGLNFNADYTFGKALGDTEGVANINQIATCRSCDMAPTDSDQTESAVFSTVYDFPLGRGRRFGANMPLAADLVLGGWELTGIITFATGTPITFTSPNTTGVPNTTIHPDRLCNGADSELSGNLRSDGFVDFNTACFASPPTGYFGNANRNPLFGPGQNNWDLGVFKTFPLHFVSENAELELRGEFFNAFNHAQFGLPNANTGAGINFGKISSEASDPREIQIAAKILF